jgi:hypothetical protein
MTQRLTKALIAEIIMKVMAATDMADRRADIIKRGQTAARNWVLASQPPALVALARVHPMGWFERITSVPVEHNTNPKAIMGMGDMCHSFWRVDFDDPLVAVDARETLKTGAYPEFDQVVAEANAWVETYASTKSGLDAVLASVRTVEALLKRMPELAPHIPKAASPDYALVAPSNVLADLMRCGLKTPA